MPYAYIGQLKTICVANYKKACTIEMDLSHLPVQPIGTLDGGPGQFFHLEYGYVLHFSAVELSAQLSWTENVSWILYLASIEVG